MKKMLMKNGVRGWFRLTPRAMATRRIDKLLGEYLNLAQAINANGSRPVRVPPMLGVDEDMRDWSLYMILEHNTIVNRAMGAVVTALARGEQPTGAAEIDPKRDVMPAATAGLEQVEAFRASVEDYLEAIAALPRLRGTKVARHPIFGDLDAHGWHCMFGFHLQLHYKQARHVVSECRAAD